MPTLEPRKITTPRLTQSAYISGDPKHPAVLLIHGNASSAPYFDRVQDALTPKFHVIAPDMRGYGKTETKPVDATRGVRDFSDDIAELLAAPELGLGDAAVHVVGWSAGGNVAMQLALDHNARVASLTLINPGSPRGYGGTKGVEGTPCHADFAGSGGGMANPRFVELLAAGERGSEDQAAPRNVMNGFYWKPPFKPAPEHEERYLDALLATATGPGNYPGDATTSDNWPGAAPGTGGMNNALSPKYLDQSGLATLERKPPLLWVRGEHDQIVSDRSMFDIGTLGELGAVPGWPGAEVFPPQPMVTQTRAVFERYAAGGGKYRELVMDAGHGPHIEQHDAFMAALGEFLTEVG